MVPPFAALSYSWGDPDDTISIGCNNGSLAILAAYTAYLLYAIRSRWGAAAEYFWADGICINQRRSAEKTKQMPS
jgi:hypothetical protein